MRMQGGRAFLEPYQIRPRQRPTISNPFLQLSMNPSVMKQTHEARAGAISTRNIPSFGIFLPSAPNIRGPGTAFDTA